MTAFTADAPSLDFAALAGQSTVREILLTWPQPNQFLTDPPSWSTAGNGGTPPPAVPMTGQIWPRALTRVEEGAGTPTSIDGGTPDSSGAGGLNGGSA